MSDRLSLLSEAGDVTITRDGYGVPHVRGETRLAAWFGMGYSCARDRMFQMDYDRRRARGRWAEIAGRSAVGADVLARRLRLAAAAERDVAAMSAPLRAAFEAYARGSAREASPFPRTPMGGDADTIQAAGYGWRGQPVHGSEPVGVPAGGRPRWIQNPASYVIPGGSSGDPASPHFADQLAEWAAHRRISMGRPPVTRLAVRRAVRLHIVDTPRLASRGCVTDEGCTRARRRSRLEDGYFGADSASCSL